MAIRGFFNDAHIVLSRPTGSGGPPPAPTAVPYVWAIVHLLKFSRRALVPFLIDTGADATTIHPQDSLRVCSESEIKALGNPTAFGGAGAGRNHYPADAVLVFIHDDGRLQAIRLTVYVAEPGPHNHMYESLLGRDALDHFVMTFDQKARTITFGG